MPLVLTNLASCPLPTENLNPETQNLIARLLVKTLQWGGLV